MEMWSNTLTTLFISWHQLNGAGSFPQDQAWTVINVTRLWYFWMILTTFLLTKVVPKIGNFFAMLENLCDVFSLFWAKGATGRQRHWTWNMHQHKLYLHSHRNINLSWDEHIYVHEMKWTRKFSEDYFFVVGSAKKSSSLKSENGITFNRPNCNSR